MNELNIIYRENGSGTRCKIERFFETYNLKTMKIKKHFLVILLSVFFSTNTFSKEPIKSCDELLSDNQYEDALKTKKDTYKK